MNAILNFLMNGSTYEVYYYLSAVIPFVDMRVGNQVVASYNDTMGDVYSYAELAENGTFSVHVPSSTTGEYAKAVYTAANGEITAVEYGITSTITKLS